MRKIHGAKFNGSGSVEIWGTGLPRREFIFADDLANACIFVMRAYDSPRPINLGGGYDLSIGELAGLLKEVVDYQGQLRFDASKPDGMPLKILDSSELIGMGWRPRTDIRSALSATYEWFLQRERGIAASAMALTA
jgi:GDP-L-fucose synthase